MIQNQTYCNMTENRSDTEVKFADVFKATLSQKDFNRLSNFIMTEYGIKMPPVKKVMLESRLQRRLKSLNITDFKDYVDYVFTPLGQKEEVIHMIDVVSTNKTDFFREPGHFDFLTNVLLPDLFRDKQYLNLKIWSAGCSSGEEPYTLAIVLSEFIEKNPCYDFTIFASDISTKMLKTAMEAIYKEERVYNIPLAIKKEYFLRSKNREEKKVRIVPELRKKVTFRRLNLIDEKYNLFEHYDIIFCRNVLIYFDRDTQEQILMKLCAHLKTGGYLFLGHSESITGLKLPLNHIQPTIYVRV